jgi:hypothetical protein
MTAPRKKPAMSPEAEARAKAIIAANLAAPALAPHLNDGITIRQRSPWVPSLSATARVANPMPAPTTCPCCGGQHIECLHHDNLSGRGGSIWPWSLLCRGCGARAGLVPFTNIPASLMEKP